MKGFFGKSKKQLLIFIIILLGPFLLLRGILPALKIARVFVVPTKSMAPALNSQDLIYVNQLSSAYKVDDIVVYSAFELSRTEIRDYISRVVAIPGDVIFIKDNNLMINDKVISDASFYLYSQFGEGSWLGNCKESYTLKVDEFFLLGDNDQISYDSRSHGPVYKSNVIGKVSFKLNAIRYWLFLF